MNFLSMCVAFLCVFSLGFSFCSLIKIKKSCSFTLMCVFFTFAVIFYTILIFLTSSLLPHSILLKTHISQGFSALSFYLIFAFAFLAGFLISFSCKIFLPLFSILYILLTIFTLHELKTFFGPQNKLIPIKIDEKSITVGGKFFDKNEIAQLTVQTFTLPDTFFLPLKRTWFFISELHESVEFPLPDFYFRDYLLKRQDVPLATEFPQESVFPSLFSAEISFSDGKAECKIERDL